MQYLRGRATGFGMTVIEAVRLCAFAPPSSPLIDTVSSFFPRSVNNVG